MQPNQFSQRLTPRPPHFLASSVALANFALISSAFYIGEALQLRIWDYESFHSRASNLRATAGTKAFCWFAPGGLAKAPGNTCERLVLSCKATVCGYVIRSVLSEKHPLTEAGQPGVALQSVASLLLVDVRKMLVVDW